MAVQLSGRYGLTAREEEVARLLLSGRSNEAIAQILQISAHTARHHTQRVLEKTGAHSRAEVAFIAARSRRSGEHRQSVGVREVVVQPAEA